jgi:hypothetical protein
VGDGIVVGMSYDISGRHAAALMTVDEGAYTLGGDHDH